LPRHKIRHILLLKGSPASPPEQFR
jgi:hypothetical protein